MSPNTSKSVLEIYPQESGRAPASRGSCPWRRRAYGIVGGAVGGGIVRGGGVVGGLVVGGVVGGGVVGGADVGTVVPSPIDVVGPGVVGSGSGAVVPTVAVDRGAVVATVGGRVLVGVATGADPAAVVGVVSTVGSTVDDVELDEDDVEVEATSGGEVRTGGRRVVTGDWVATWRVGELSGPVATSNSRATMATDART